MGPSLDRGMSKIITTKISDNMCEDQPSHP